MVRIKKGQRAKQINIWAKAGGRDAVVDAFLRHDFGKKKKNQQHNWEGLARDIFTYSSCKMC